MGKYIVKITPDRSLCEFTTTSRKLVNLAGQVACKIDSKTKS